MKTNPNERFPEPTSRGESLIKLLRQTEHVKALMKELAEELSSVNTIIKQDFLNDQPSSAVEKVLGKTQTMESKAHDVSKKLTLVNLVLEGEVRERSMVDHQLAAITEQEEAARYAAFHDVLTGLPNRALFNDRLEHGLAQAKRHGWTLAVMFVDLNKFKSVNDTYGHEAGDNVLQTVARRLAEKTRGDDTVSRHGGDEFLYLLTELHNEHDIAMIAEKIIHAIEVPIDFKVGDVHITSNIGASIGISTYPKNGASAPVLIKSADEAMYRAKQSQSGYAFAQ